ncbi:hypothetical protein CU103_08290 [Phyllobacterium sophorae]|uniref:Uncharacterized protein n=1 Tax=Phyllobacterium sophorae TaxID=1520277 RepID=A0A2P7BEV5_9HYPH|nr:hypothetical protein CU103_08290 [Phyllobacterium sophorae]
MGEGGESFSVTLEDRVSLITKAKAIMTQIATISHWDEPISEYDAQSNANNRKNIACFQMKYTLWP